MSATDPDTSPFYFSRQLAGRRDQLVLGVQTCASCRTVQLCAWPVGADIEVLTFECSACGEMAAEFVVAHPLEMFPDYDVTVKSRRAWLEAEPHAPYKES